MEWRKVGNTKHWVDTESKDRGLIGIVVMLIVLFICLVCSSCKTIKEVPVEVIKERIEYIDHIKYDSIYKRDSIYVQAVGDTICVYKDKYIYKYQFVHDTTFVSRIDSVPYLVEVEKKLTQWEGFKMQVGGVSIPIIILLVCCGIGYAIKKFV